MWPTEMPGAACCAEKQLEQELIARRVVAKGNGEPLLQALAAGGCDRVGAARPVACVRPIRRDQAFADQSFQSRIELTIALAPEKSDALFDCLANLISRLVVMNGEDAEDDISCSASIPYSSKIYLKDIFVKRNAPQLTAVFFSGVPPICFKHEKRQTDRPAAMERTCLKCGC